MGDYIKVLFKDGSFFETNGVLSVIWAADELIILFKGIFGQIDSKTIDGVTVKSYFVSRGD